MIFSMVELKIAILDNDIKFAAIVKHLLTRFDFYSVQIFKNITELEQSDYNPTLIITEINFKLFSGKEVIETLKKHYKDALIFVMSNTKRISDSLVSIVSGASIFLRKQDFLENKNILFEKIGAWVEKQKPIDLILEESFNNIEKKVLAYEYDQRSAYHV